MIQLLSALILSTGLISCDKKQMEIPDNVIIGNISPAQPEEIGSWPGTIYAFRDGAGVNVFSLEKISETGGFKIEEGDAVVLVAFEKADFISANTEPGLPADKYMVGADMIGKQMPRIWSGKCDQAAEGGEAVINPLPVTSAVNIKVINAPDNFGTVKFSIEGLMNDTYWPATESFSAEKYSSVEIVADKDPVSFNMFPMNDGTSAWKPSLELTLGDITYVGKPQIGRRIGSGENVEIVLDLSKSLSDGRAEFRYSATDIMTGKKYECSESFMLLTEEEQAVTESNTHYNVFISKDGKWTPVKVYDALCSDADNHGAIWNDWGNDRKLRDTMSYCIFEHPFDGPVKVRVQKKDGSFSDAAVRPSVWNITARETGYGMVEFELPSYEKRKVSVEFDGDRQHNLFLLPHRPDPDKPDASAPNVIYFGPGEHERDGIRLSDGQTLYIDYGAVLYSTVEVDGDNCTIAGHGILSGDRLRHWGGDTWNNGEIIIRCNGSRSSQRSGLTVKDISIINCPSWNLAVWNFDNVLIDGVNIIDWGLNGDGIDLMCCRNAEVRNCFIRTYDDCITLKLRHNTAYDGPYTDLQDIKVHDNLIWNDYARGIVVGPESGSKTIGTGYIHDIEIYDCIFLQHKRGNPTDDLRAAFAIGQMSSPDGGVPERIENVTARNLVFDNISNTGRNVWIYQYPSPGTATMSDILLENFTIFDGEGVVTPALKVSAEYGSIKGLHLRNILFNGSKITAEGEELEVDGDVEFNIE